MMINMLIDQAIRLSVIKLFIFSSLLLSGCTTVTILPRHDQTPSAINQELYARNVTVSLFNGTTFKSRQIAVAQGTLFGVNYKGESFTLPFSDVSELYYHRPGRGLLAGALVAFIGGGAILLTPSSSEENPLDPLGISTTGFDKAKPLVIAGLFFTSIGLGSIAEGTRKYVIYSVSR